MFGDTFAIIKSVSPKAAKLVSALRITKNQMLGEVEVFDDYVPPRDNIEREERLDKLRHKIHKNYFESRLENKNKPMKPDIIKGYE